MKKYIIASVVMALAVLSSGCKKSETMPMEQQNFMMNSNYGLYMEGMQSMAYDKYAHQLVRNEDGTSFRIQSDDLKQYVSCSFSSRPSAEGEEITVGYSTGGLGLLSSYSGTFKVVKISDTMVWLWDKQNKNGIIAYVK